jgi:PRC-barrel domain protein
MTLAVLDPGWVASRSWDDAATGPNTVFVAAFSLVNPKVPTVGGINGRCGEVAMRNFFALFVAALALAATIEVRCNAALAQAAPTEQAQTTKPLSPPPAAKEYEGRDVFTSDGQQLGKVTKANTQSDGNVKDIEVQSAGFLGFFSSTYVVPIGKTDLKGGRVDLSITGEQAKQLTK